MEAIGDGLATDQIDTVTLKKRGDMLLTCSLPPRGYSMISGVDVFRLTGAMPTIFAKMTELLALLDTNDILAMGPTTRVAFFADLLTDGLTGFLWKVTG